MKANGSRLFIAILTVSIACKLASVAEVTVFDPLDTGTWELTLAPDGSVWFIQPDPLRIFRIQEDQMEQVAFSAGGFASDLVPGMTVTPDGDIWFIQNSHEAAWLSEVHLYHLTPDWALQDVPIDLSEIPYTKSYGIYSDASSRLFARIYCYGQQDGTTILCKIHPGDTSYLFEAGSVQGPLFGSMQDVWIGAYDEGIYGNPTPHTGIYRISTETGDVLAHYGAADGLSYQSSFPVLVDSEDRLWVLSSNIVSMRYLVFDGTRFRPAFPEIGGIIFGSGLVAAADLTIWVPIEGSAINPGILRVDSSGYRTFGKEDGLPERMVFWPQFIDFDGRVWGLAARSGVYDSGKLIWRISDGGWPPMRLMLNITETPESISVEAQVINNGPVAGVDVYIALELNGQLLYWPNWTPEPHANQVNLRPGHNQTATIIEMPREQIPPGSYTVWGCMTVRDSQKLIGQLDRKFESVTVVVAE